MEARDLGDTGDSPRLAERAALMTRAGRRHIGLHTREPGVGKTTVCGQAADSLHYGLSRPREVGSIPTKGAPG